MRLYALSCPCVFYCDPAVGPYLQNMFYFTGETQESHMGCMTTRHTALFFVRKHYQQRATAPTIVRLTLISCDLGRELGGETLCVKKLFE